jgi:trafficking protein particle complex subunit 13
MQTPSQSISLELHGAEGIEEGTGPGSSLQKIIKFDLKEEGNHVLAVNVTYTETTTFSSDTIANSGRVRSFRKLYQFAAVPCISVRTKATELAALEIPDKSHGPYGTKKLLRWVLEAQLENVSDAGIVLEETRLQPRQPFRATSLNWDTEGDGKGERPLIKPRDIMQVAFVAEQVDGVAEGVEELGVNLRRDGRTVLGQLAISWRTTMGERGALSTGNLLTRRRAA